jgi:hypothetical protein
MTISVVDLVTLGFGSRRLTRGGAARTVVEC